MAMAVAKRQRGQRQRQRQRQSNNEADIEAAANEDVSDISGEPVPSPFAGDCKRPRRGWRRVRVNVIMSQIYRLLLLHLSFLEHLRQILS